MIGAGKYDDICQQVVKQTGAEHGALVIVVHAGEHGCGVGARLSREAAAILPDVLRSIADDLERDAASLNNALNQEPS